VNSCLCNVWDPHGCSFLLRFVSLSFAFRFLESLSKKHTAFECIAQVALVALQMPRCEILSTQHTKLCSPCSISNVSDTSQRHTSAIIGGTYRLCLRMVGHHAVGFAWRLAVLRSPLFKFVVRRGPLLAGHCICFFSFYLPFSFIKPN
jgi:hypothetical protein